MNNKKNLRNEFLIHARDWSKPRPEFLQQLHFILFTRDNDRYSEEVVTDSEHTPILQH